MILILIFILLIPLFFIKRLKFIYHLYKLDIPSPEKCYPLIGHVLWVFGLDEEGMYFFKSSFWHYFVIASKLKREL
jgi:hypothetical protein